MRNLLVVSLAAAVLTAGARSAEAQPVPAEQAVQRLQATLATIPHLNEADLLSEETGPRYGAARSFIRERQCAARSANPLLPVAHPTGTSLRAAGDSVAQPSAASGFEFSLRVVALSDVPNLYLGDMSALAEARGLPAELGAKLKQEIPGAYRTLVARTLRMIDEYNPAGCERVPHRDPRGPRPPFVFVVPTY